LNSGSPSAAVELCEILNISESGTCIQAPGMMKVNRLLPLVLDLSETGTRIHTAGHIVWAESSGRVGIRFPELSAGCLQQLRQWMSINEAAAKSNPATGRPMNAVPVIPAQAVRPKPRSAASYSSLIAEWAEIQRDVDLFGPNVEGALHLIAERALALTWASGAVIALKDENHPTELVCVARAGHDSPELGVHLDAKLGFCGDCIRTATIHKCDDTEHDVSAESKGLRDRGIRSVIACPIKTVKGAIIGVFEIFSSEAAAFWDNDARTLERLARIVEKAVTHAMQSAGKVVPVIEREITETVQPETAAASLVEPAILATEPSDTGRTVTLFATGILAVVFAVWLTAPWIVEAMNSVISPPKSQAAQTLPAIDYSSMSIPELRKTALSGSPTAQYAMAMRYATGDGVDQDYHEALAWFLKAAENGDLRAAPKIASCFWAGKGAQQDYSKAYFWGLLAQTTGDETGKVIVINTGPHLSDHQRAAEQQEADAWVRSHGRGSSRGAR
jgi:putative methionine-R-sulfoxide reductase with GAF domain